MIISALPSSLLDGTYGKWRIGNTCNNVLTIYGNLNYSSIVVKTPIPTQGLGLDLISIKNINYDRIPYEIQVVFTYEKNKLKAFQSYTGPRLNELTIPPSNGNIVNLFTYTVDTVEYVGINIDNTAYPIHACTLSYTSSHCSEYCNGWTYEYSENLITDDTSAIVPTRMGFLPTTINNKPFNGADDLILTPEDLGAATFDHTHSDYVSMNNGGVMKNQLIAQDNANYTTYQVRNIALSDTASVPTGNGSILGVYS